jgi:DNA relaxase NicK
MSPVVADTLREMFDHRPARIDGCRDISAPKLFDRLIRLTRRMAKDYRLRWEPDGDWATPDAGRTIYLGSRSSQVMLRIYEKGLEMAAKQGLPVTDDLRNLVRCEVEFKPQNQTARRRAAVMPPDAIWGLTDWLVEFAGKVFTKEVGRVNVSERREADYERALRFMAEQYRAHLARLLDECGGDLDEFALAILRRAKLAI